MRDGTTLFLATLDGVDDDHLERPTALPGWTGKHVVAHGRREPDVRVTRAARARDRTRRDAAAGRTALVQVSAGELADALAALSP